MIQNLNNREDYIGTGATAIYAYTFRIFVDADLKVIKTSVDGTLVETLVLTTDYTVSGAGLTAGGNITLVAGNLPADEKLVIIRDLPLLQPTDIRNQGGFLPDVHEDALDRGVMLDQKRAADFVRALSIPENLTGISAAMPAPVANMFLQWNATADAIALAASPAGGYSTIGATYTLNPWVVSTDGTQAHGLAAAPTFVVGYLECLTAEYDYAIGERVDVNTLLASVLSIHYDATNLYVTTHSALQPQVVRRDTNAAGNLTFVNWKLVVTPYLIN